MFDFYLQPLFWIMVLLLLIQLAVYLFLFRRVAAYKSPAKGVVPYTPLTVIIAAKNEDENLRENLPLILEQDYPEYEVIVVDDQSEDDTPHTLKIMAQQHPKLKVVTIKDHIYEFAGKKLALTLGIKAATHETLVLTDADCKPESRDWLKRMAEGFSSPQTEIVLGFSPYRRYPGLLNLFIRFETFMTALQYFSFALAGMPYMGVGRNLAYRKSLFFKNKGFAPFLKISSGDDDLFVNRNATKDNIGVQLDADSFMLSQPKRSFGEWFGQKHRHMQTGKLYHAKHKRALSLLWIGNILFYASVVLGILFLEPFWIALAILGLRLIVQIIVVYKCAQRLKSTGIVAAFPLLDVFYQVIYLPFMAFIGLFRRKKRSW